MHFVNRYLITLLSSIIRAGLNFFVSIQLAKYLMPEDYGNYQYILTISTAILLFMNLNTENAFFTFISKKKQNIKFYFTYFIWQFLQILLIFLFVLLLNEDIYQLLFKNIELGLIFISFGASFFVGNIQKTCNHMIESIRKTYISQSLSILVSILHLVIVLSFIYINSLSIKLLFQVLLFEYLLYTLVIFIYIRKNKQELFCSKDFDLQDIVKRFYFYCKPIFILAILAFFYVFIDRWLIQNYIGAEGQAFFSISMQFSALSILISSSILKVFWKEISESIEEKNIRKTKRYLIVISENLFVFTTVIASTLFFFSNDILNFFYSDDYIGASLVFKLMMLYPIFQSMGQLYTVFLLGTEQTKLYRNITIYLSLLSILIAIIFLADFGLNLGVEAIAVKLLLMNFLSIVILEYHIMKYLKSSSRFLKKLKYFTIIFFISYIVYIIQVYLNFIFLVQVSIVTLFYILPVGIYLFNNLKKKI